MLKGILIKLLSRLRWNFMVVSPKNICSLSDDSILRPGAGGWCRAANLPSMPPCAQEEGCPSRSRTASRPCGLQSFTENVLHHLASVAKSTQSKFLAFVMPVWSSHASMPLSSRIAVQFERPATAASFCMPALHLLKNA